MTGADMANAIVGYGIGLLALASIWVYFAPAIVAHTRGRASVPITILTVTLGWTVLGWIAALIWATTERSAREERARRAAA